MGSCIDMRAWAWRQRASPLPSAHALPRLASPRRALQLVFPLTNLRRLTALVKVNSWGAAFIAFTIAFVIYHGVHALATGRVAEGAPMGLPGLPESEAGFTLWGKSTFGKLAGMGMLSFFVHNAAHPILRNANPKYHSVRARCACVLAVRGSRACGAVQRNVMTAYAIVATFYAVVGAFGYCGYLDLTYAGKKVADNFLDAFPDTCVGAAACRSQCSLPAASLPRCLAASPPFCLSASGMGSALLHASRYSCSSCASSRCCCSSSASSSLAWRGRRTRSGRVRLPSRAPPSASHECASPRARAGRGGLAEPCRAHGHVGIRHLLPQHWRRHALHGRWRRLLHHVLHSHCHALQGEARRAQPGGRTATIAPRIPPQRAAPPRLAASARVRVTQRWRPQQQRRQRQLREQQQRRSGWFKAQLAWVRGHALHAYASRADGVARRMLFHAALLAFALGVLALQFM